MIFIVTTSEFSLLLFYQLQFTGIDGQLSAVSFYVGIITLGYFLAVFFWVIVRSYNIFDSRDTDTLNTYAFMTYYLNKQKTSQKLFYSIFMFRKILCSVIYVAGFNDPVGQIVGLFLIYLFYFLYMAISRPFIQS